MGASNVPARPGIDLFACLALLVLTLITFSPALSAEFVRWDDPTFITDNPYIRSFSPENLAWMFTAFRGGHYHPLTWLSWTLDSSIWGSGPGAAQGFHLTNILLHAASAILVYFLLKRLIALASRGRSTPALAFASFLGAAVFALHPLRAESVAWATERRDVLSAFFLLAATLFYLRSADPATAPGGIEPTKPFALPRPYLLSILFLILSCLSKAWGMSFFAILLVLDIYPLSRFSIDPRTWFSHVSRRVLIEKLPFLFIGLITAALAAAAQHSGLAAKTLEQWGIRERMVQSFYGLWFYARTTLWPDALSPLYQLPEHINPAEPRFIAAYIFVGVAALAVIAFRKRLPALAAAAAIYGICLAPVLGILQSGEQFVADRYSYLACLVFSALLAGAIVSILRWCRENEDAATRRKPAALLCIAVPVVATLALAVLTYAQTGIWHSTETLWAHAVTTTPSSQVFTNYAVELERLGRNQEADEAAHAATQLNPTDGRAWFTYGSRMRDKGNLAEAEKAFKEATRYMPQAYQAYQNLGVMYAKHNYPEAAMEMFRLAVADVEKGGRRPLSGGPYMTLAFALQDAKRNDEARAMFEKAATFPDTREAAAKELQAMGK